MIQAIVTDIEGTTSSLSFVKDVLFPYARAHLAEFVRHHHEQPDVRQILADVSIIAQQSLTDEEAIAQLLQWSDEDKKITPLKALQGLIWEYGYHAGAFQGHIYEDAVRQLRHWHQQGIKLYIYSSGSVHAQKLLFGHTEHGDLTPLFSGYFDTRSGAKQEEASYRRIQSDIGLPAATILFLSDIVAELDAAAAAGMQTRWLVRDGQIPPDSRHTAVADFDAICVMSV